MSCNFSQENCTSSSCVRDLINLLPNFQGESDLRGLTVEDRKKRHSVETETIVKLSAGCRLWACLYFLL